MKASVLRVLAPLAVCMALALAAEPPTRAPAMPATAATRRAAAAIVCTPTSIEQQGKGQAPQPVNNPIAEALSKAQPGSTIWLDPGDYPAFTIGFQSNSPANAARAGGEPGNPVVVEGSGPDVRILGVEGDTIAIDQRIDNGWITFRNLTIVPGRRAGVMFYQRTDGKAHRGYTFEDVHVLGAFDFDTGQGKRTKWAVWGQGVADFRFAGVTAPARIESISEEHAFYQQNLRGPVTIENVHAKDLGRTFCQFTARAKEGPPSIGDVTVRDCVIEDACIAQADGFKGGSAITLCGRAEGTFLFERNVYRAGFRPERQRLTTKGLPYGTGAFTAWEEGGGGMNGTLVLRDNEFAFAPGCGDRPVVSIGGCERVLLVGANKIVSGGKQPALSLDPVNNQGQLVSSANGPTYLAPATVIEGAVLIGGKPADPARLAELRKERDEPPAEAPAEAPVDGADPEDG
jgi:hypothetical protein